MSGAAPFRLEPVRAAHLPLLAALHAQCFEDAWDEESLGALLLGGGGSGCLAVEGDDPLGFILFTVAADQAEILTICVRPDRRGRAVGRRLVAEAARIAVHAGAVEMFLEVAEDNAPARRLYDRLGFGPVGRRRGYYRCGRDALVLSRRL